jgi:hypothetical protein
MSGTVLEMFGTVLEMSGTVLEMSGTVLEIKWLLVSWGWFMSWLNKCIVVVEGWKFCLSFNFIFPGSDKKNIYENFKKYSLSYTNQRSIVGVKIDHLLNKVIFCLTWLGLQITSVQWYEYFMQVEEAVAINLITDFQVNKTPTKIAECCLNYDIISLSKFLVQI